ncbi:MAG: MipA/OmpV family protein [Hyphomonadaceae bacterium]
MLTGERRRASRVAAWLHAQHRRWDAADGDAPGRIRFGRSDDGEQAFAVSGDDTHDLQGLGDVDTSVELVGFASYDVGAVTLRLEARQAINGHDGLVADLAAQWSGRSRVLGAARSWSVGPRVRFVDEAGLCSRQRTALVWTWGKHGPALGADNRWSAVLIAGYDRLAGDAADSPLVQLGGSEDQTSRL